MNSSTDKVWHKLMELSVISGMNQRYAQYMATDSERWGMLIDAAVVVSTVLCLVFAVAAYFASKKSAPFWAWPHSWKVCKRENWTVYRVRFDVASLLLAVLSAMSAIVLVVAPSNENANHYNRMLQSWTDLRQDVDSVIADADADAVEPINGNSELAYLERRYRELLAKKNSLNAREPAPDIDLLEHFLTLEENSRAEPIDRKVDPSGHASSVSFSQF